MSMHRLVCAGVMVVVCLWACFSPAAEVTATAASMLLNGDTLVVEEPGVGGNVTVSAASADAANTLTYALASKVKINKAANTSATLLIGNAAPTAEPVLVRSGKGTLTILPVNVTTTLGVNEKFVVNGAGANLPATANGMASAAIIARNVAGGNGVGRYVYYDSVNGFKAATEYANFAGADNTKIVLCSATTNLTSDAACYSLRVADNYLTVSATLTVGNGTGAAGIFLDRSTDLKILGTGIIDFATSELIIHSPGITSTIDPVLKGSGGITKSGTSTLSLINTNNAFTGGLTILEGLVLTRQNPNAGLGPIGSIGNNVIYIANGACLYAGASPTLTNDVVLIGGDTNRAAMLATSNGGGSIVLTNKISGVGNLGLNNPSLAGTTAFVYGSNTYEGATIVYKNAAYINHNFAFGAGTGPVIFDSTVVPVTLWVQNYSPVIGSLRGPTNAVVDLGNAASTLTIGNDNGHAEFAGEIKNKGTVVKIGTGMQTLSGSNTYNSGYTIISNGLLRVANTTGSATGPGPVLIASGGTLGGTGTVSGVVTNLSGGALAAGVDAAGTLTLAGGLTLNNGSILKCPLGVSAGKLSITGGTFTGSGAGGVSVELSDAGGIVKNQPYTLLDWTGATASGVELADFYLAGSIGGASLSLEGTQLKVTIRPHGTMVYIK